MKHVNHIFLFCCCLLIFPFLSVTKSYATGYCCCADGSQVWSADLAQAECEMKCGDITGSQDNPPLDPDYFPGGCHGNADDACGSSNGGSFSSPPSSNLCAYGTPTSVTTGATEYTWSCTGGAGVPACSAARIIASVNGSCGPQHNGVFFTPPGDGTPTYPNGYYSSLNPPGLCSSGTPSSVTGSGPWAWSCNGSGGGSNASCSATKGTSATCGHPEDVQVCWVDSVNGTSHCTNLKALQKSGNVYSSHPGVSTRYHFSPIMANTASHMIVSLNIKNSSGTVLRSIARRFDYGMTRDEILTATSGPITPSSASTITSSSSIPPQNAQGGSTINGSNAEGGNVVMGWISTEKNSGTYGHGNSAIISITHTCNPPTNGSCGAANGVGVTSAPSSGLCGAGTATAVSGSGPWTWSCNGANGGTNASCSAPLRVDGVCGATNNNCNAGTLNDIADTGTHYQWVCNGINGGSNSATCSQVIPVTPVAGTCGTASGSSFASAPSSNLCGAGNGVATPAPSGSGPWSWTCGGSGGGAASGTCSATQTAPVVNGTCGSSHGGTFGNSTPPTSNLCNNGSATSVTTNPTTYTWSCNGSGGGTNSSCTATRSAAGVNGVCGADHGGVFSSAPSNLCDVGTASAITNGGGDGSFWGWTCYGSGGGSDALCGASRPVGVNGTCGSANGSSFATAPTSNLCGAGNGVATPAPSGSGPWSWTCGGSGSGSASPTCSATQTAPVVNGSCGTANGAGTTAAPSSGLCSTGTAGAVAGSGPWTWSCNGSGGGTTASCSAPLQVSGTCGTANGVGVTSAPSSGLCGGGTATAVSGSGPWTWSCNGSGGGTNASCSAPLRVDGACGSSHNGNFYTSAGITNQCSAGTASGISGSGPWSWSCTGSNGGTTASCSANQRIDGTCGTANNVGRTDAPSANLCGYTSSPATVSGSGPWTWTCSGSNSGSNASCGAQRNGACGTSHGGNFVTKADITDPCSSGTATTIIGAGPYNWTCVGSAASGSIPAGTTASCTAQLATPGECGAAHNMAWSSPPPAMQLCQAGTASAVANPSTNYYTWTCNGINSPTNASCNSALIVKGTCGSAHLVPRTSAPSANLCGPNNTATAVTGSGPWSWYCNGSPNTPVNRSPLCSAPLPPPPPNFGGSCPGP